jgi:TRAP-type transport system periplasmic protein
MAATALVRAPARSAQFEFKCASSLPADHPSTIRLTQMWAAIEQESAGRVHTLFYPNGQLGTQSAVLTQLRIGALTFLSIDAGNVATIVPVADIFFLGFAFRDQDEADRVLNGSVGGYVRDQAAAKGLHVFRTAWDSGMFQIGSNLRPIRTPDDLHGFKIRVAESKIVVDLFKGLGASPTPITITEVYTALQTKLVDGEAGPLVTIETSKFYEVNKYISLTNHSFAGQLLIANGDTWKTLPSDLQDVIDRNVAKFAALESNDVKAGNAAVATQLARQGMIINRVDQTPFRTRLRPYFAEWAGTFGPTAWGLLESSLGRKLV